MCQVRCGWHAAGGGGGIDKGESEGGGSHRCCLDRRREWILERGWPWWWWVDLVVDFEVGGRAWLLLEDWGERAGERSDGSRGVEVERL